MFFLFMHIFRKISSIHNKIRLAVIRQRSNIGSSRHFLLAATIEQPCSPRYKFTSSTTLFRLSSVMAVQNTCQKAVRQKRNIVPGSIVDRSAHIFRATAGGLNIYTLMPMRRFEHQRRGCSIPPAQFVKINSRRRASIRTLLLYTFCPILVDDIVLVFPARGREGFEKSKGTQNPNLSSPCQRLSTAGLIRTRKHKLCATSKHQT